MDLSCFVTNQSKLKKVATLFLKQFTKASHSITAAMYDLCNRLKSIARCFLSDKHTDVDYACLWCHVCSVREVYKTVLITFNRSKMQVSAPAMLCAFPGTVEGR